MPQTMTSLEGSDVVSSNKSYFYRSTEDMNKKSTLGLTRHTECGTNLLT